MSQECSLIIKNLSPGLTERGKIKIGEKGKWIKSSRGKEFQPPQKLDHFRVTTLERGPDGNFVTDRAVHAIYGERPRELPVRLLYDEIELNFQSRYTCYIGRTLKCFGDGEVGFRLQGTQHNGKREEIPCPCGRQDPTYLGDDRCRINTCLSVIIDGVDSIGGVWKFRTSSYNSTVGILSSLALFKRLTGGPLAGIPLVLTLHPKTVIVPTSGKAMQVWVAGLEFRGGIEQLQQIAYQQAERLAIHQAKIERIEEQARKLIAASSVVDLEVEADDIVEEFYPEQAAKSLHEEGQNQPPDGYSTPEAPPARRSEEDNDEYRVHEGNKKVGGRDQGDEQGPNAVEAGAGDRAVESEASRGNRENKKPKRVRRNKFTVDQTIFGTPLLNTCGVTPEQLMSLKDLAVNQAAKDEITEQVLQITGYEQWSYLRADEATDLISRLQATSAPGDPSTGNEAIQQVDDPPRQYIQCPENPGDNIDIDAYCLAGRCRMRSQNGWCPILGEEPPVSTEEVMS